MLKNRIVTASLLAPLIIAAILFLSPDGFAMLWGVLILVGAWEWGDLAGLKGGARGGFVAGIAAIMALARYYAIQWAPGELPVWFYAAAVLWWVVLGLAFRKAPEKLAKYPYPQWARVLAGLWTLTTGWILMVWLRLNFSEYQVLYLVLLIWLADIAAYFTGKNWGFTKLATAISPGKTVEGVYGSLFAAIIMAVAVGLVLQYDGLALADFAFLSLFTVAFSVVGDLFESLAKRVRGVKDSGGLLPGHGGMLDRIDSLLSSVAVFYAGSLLIPIFLQMGASLQPEIILQGGDEPTSIEAPADHDHAMPADAEPPAMEEHDHSTHDHGAQGHGADEPAKGEEAK